MTYFDPSVYRSLYDIASQNVVMEDTYNAINIVAYLDKLMNTNDASLVIKIPIGKKEEAFDLSKFVKDHRSDPAFRFHTTLKSLHDILATISDSYNKELEKGIM